MTIRYVRDSESLGEIPRLFELTPPGSLSNVNSAVAVAVAVVAARAA
jgi:hypothetical protein